MYMTFYFGDAELNDAAPKLSRCNMVRSNHLPCQSIVDEAAKLPIHHHALSNLYQLLLIQNG